MRNFETKLQNPCSVGVAGDGGQQPLRVHLPQADLPPQRHLPLLQHLLHHRRHIRKVKQEIYERSFILQGAALTGWFWMIFF